MEHARKLIIEQIRLDESRLAKQDEERRDIAKRLNQLRTRLTTLAPEDTSPEEPSPRTQTRGYDYVDGLAPILAKMHEKQMKGFRAMGYKQAGAQTI